MNTNKDDRFEIPISQLFNFKKKRKRIFQEGEFVKHKLDKEQKKFLVLEYVSTNQGKEKVRVKKNLEETQEFFEAELELVRWLNTKTK